MGKVKPIIYGDTMDCMDFLNEYEKAYLNCGSPDIKKMLATRANMFHSIHRAWNEYDSKTGETKKLSLKEWKVKSQRILNLQFHFKNEQVKGIVDNYFTKVDFPKGGLVK